MKIGFLGAGAMGGAILSGAVKTGVVKAEDVYVSDFSDAIKAKYKEMGCHIADSNEELGKSVDILVACVKPQYAAGALSELGDSLDGKAMISIMAGLTTESLREMTGGSFRLLRLMPNTPALVGCGAFALDSGTDLTAEEKEFAQKLFESIGIVEWMPENTSLSRHSQTAESLKDFLARLHRIWQLRLLWALPEWSSRQVSILDSLRIRSARRAATPSLASRLLRSTE